VKRVSDEGTEELKEKILKYLETVSKAKNKDVARAIGVEKSLVDKTIGELGKEGKIEYLYLGTSFIKLKGKEE
jgi:Mn-dependent DtxR family transcriptional regulator